VRRFIEQPPVNPLENERIYGKASTATVVIVGKPLD
jgi:hypothetical protein